MKGYLLAIPIFSLSIILFLKPLALKANQTDYLKEPLSNQIELPSALADDDSFNELPFEQLRQALREEVEHDPNKTIRPLPSKRYNFLIR